MKTKQNFYKDKAIKLMKLIPTDKLHKACKVLETFASLPPLEDRIEASLDILRKK